MSSLFRPPSSSGKSRNSSTTPSALINTSQTVAQTQPQLYHSVRQATFNASIPICIRLADGDAAAALIGGAPIGSAEGALESFMFMGKRCGYFGSWWTEIKTQLIGSVLDDLSLENLKLEDVYLTNAVPNGGGPVKWHWPIGLLHDYHRACLLSQSAPSSSATTPTALSPPSSFHPPRHSNASTTSIGSSHSGGSTLGSHLAPLNFNLPSTRQGDLSPFGNSSSLSTSSPDASSTPTATLPPADLPWELVLHLRPPTGAAAAGLGVNDPTSEGARSMFYNMTKEAEMMRRGSTKKITSLRNKDQDSLWEAVESGDFEVYWSIASRLIPAPISLSNETTSRFSNSTNSTASSTLTITPSSPGLGAGDGSNEGWSSVKSIPVRLYLPENSLPLQDSIPPFQEDGRPTTLSDALSILLPSSQPPPPSSLLFTSTPRPPSSASAYSTTSSIKSSPSPSLPNPSSRSVAIISQGVSISLDAELYWLAGCACGTDGWLAMVVVYLAK